jgi:hypothetical protein
MGNFTHDNFIMDDLKVFEGRQAFDFDKGRERIITTILVDCFFLLKRKTKQKNL